MNQQQQQQYLSNNSQTESQNKKSLQLREALSEQRIKELRSLINQERKTKALPQIKLSSTRSVVTLGQQPGSITSNNYHPNAMQARRSKDRQSKDFKNDNFIVRSSNRFETFEMNYDNSQVHQRAQFIYNPRDKLYQTEDIQSPTAFKVNVIQLKSSPSQGSKDKKALTKLDDHQYDDKNYKTNKHKSSDDFSHDDHENRMPKTLNNSDLIENDISQDYVKDIENEDYKDREQQVAAQIENSMMDNSISYLDRIDKGQDQETSYDDDYNIIRKKSTLYIGSDNNNQGHIRVEQPDNQGDQNDKDNNLNKSTLQKLNEMEELKNKLLEYKVDVNKLLGNASPKTKIVDPSKFKVQDALNFNSIFMNKDINNKQMVKSSSTKEIQLPKINLKRSIQMNREELEEQKKVIGKIINDKEYILSMEYLKEQPNLYDIRLNPHSLRSSILSLKNSMIDQEKQKQTFIQQIQQQNLRSGMLPRKQLKNFDSFNSKLSSIKNIKHGENGNYKILQSQQSMNKNTSKSILSPNNQRTLKSSKQGQKQQSNSPQGNASYQKGIGISPLHITKAYQEFLDTNRGGSNDNPNYYKTVNNMSRMLQQNTNNNLEVLTYNGSLKSHLSMGNLKEKQSHTQSEMNLFRQKLNSSNGRKHFIVAYEMTKILRDNKLELECNDYKKIKDIISDMSKKRFESRPNNIRKPFLPNALSVQEAEKLTLKLNMLN